MNTKSEWINNNADSLFYSKDDTILEIKENFDVRRYYSSEGFNVVIDGTETQVIIQSHSNPLNEGKFDRKIHMPIETIVNTGSIVEWENNKWIVTSGVDDIQAYKTASMIKTNNVLKFYNKNCILFTYPCVINKGNLSEETNRFMNLAADEYMLCTTYNADTSNINKNTRFLLSGNAYGVVGVDNISQNGLLWIRIKEGSITTDDNLPENIADYYKNQVLREVNILNGTLIKKFFGDAPFQINIQCKENGVVVENPTVTYQSGNTQVCTISTTGLVTLVGTGITDITVTFGNTEDSVTIQSDVMSQDNYNVVLTPSDITIKANRSLTLNAMVTNNGINDSLKQVGFEVLNDDGTTNQYITYIVNNNSIILTAGSIYNKFINIKAYMLAYPNIFITRQIKIISLV